MTSFFGRRSLLDRIHELHRSQQHVSLVGARQIGKTAVLRTVVGSHAKGSEVFTGAGLVDLRHDPPTSTDGALKRIGAVIRDAMKNSAAADLRDLAGYVDTDSAPEELYDQLKIALDSAAEAGRKLLIALDGCDQVLQNSAIPRNLWDNLRALAQTSSLRLMTASRDQLHKLCYNPEARTSDFFRIFYDEPLIVGPLDEADWKDLYANCGLKLDVPAQKEFVNWTGGHPDLVDALLGRVTQLAQNGSAGKREVDEAAESLLSKAVGRLHSLWMECPADTRGDIVQLARGEMSAADLPRERVRYLVERGIALESGNKVRLCNRFVERLAGARKQDVSGARQLFERPEDFATNIRTVLELRIAQLQGTDAELTKLARRAVKHLPDEPDAALSSARDILDRALELIWAVEAPDGKVPKKWIEHWKEAEITTGRPVKAVADFSRSQLLPEERGFQCALLRLATGQQRIRPCAQRLSKTTYVLLEHVNQVGDMKNHSRADPSVPMAAAFCMTAIELIAALAKDLK